MPEAAPQVMVIPSLLYKYLTAERALACLPEVGDGALRATQPNALNDPFEYHTLKTFVERDRAEGNEKLARVLTELHSTVPVTSEEVDQARDSHGSIFLRELLVQQMSRRCSLLKTWLKFLTSLVR